MSTQIQVEKVGIRGERETGGRRGGGDEKETGKQANRPTDRQRMLQKVHTCLTSILIPYTSLITHRFAMRSPRLMNVRSPDDGFGIDSIASRIVIS